MSKLTSEQSEALDCGNGPVLVEYDQSNRHDYLVDVSTFHSLQQYEDLAAIRDGIADMRAVRVLTLDELDARIRPRLEAADPKPKSRGPFTVLPLV